MKKLKFAVLLATLICGGGKCYAHDIEVANADGVTIYYNYTNDQTELEVTYPGSYSSNYAGNVVIPESVTYEGDTYPVTSIGNSAFGYCSRLTKVTIPNSVTSIGILAFNHCSSLTEVTIPGSVTSIDDFAFNNCTALTSVTIGSGLASIGDALFEDCPNLEKIVVESGNPIYDSREDCNAVIQTAINTLVVGCKNTHFPNSVTAIGDQAFFGCSGLTEITIPSNITSLGYYNPFSDCVNLEKIVVESGHPVFDSRDNCNAIIKTNENSLVSGCKKTKIPNSVTAIDDYAFSHCSSLTELTIPNSVTYIGDGAFNYCSGLTELIIPYGVTSIGYLTFQSCDGLTKMIVPNSVTSIGHACFNYCQNLTEVVIGNSVTSIISWAFRNCNKLSTIYSLNTTPPSVGSENFTDKQYETAIVYVPKEALSAYQSADKWEEFKNLQAIGDDDDIDAIAKVSVAEQIYSANGQVTVTGLTDGTTVTVYDLSGQQVGQATSKGGQTTVNTRLTSGSTAIVKMGEWSVKTVMK